MSEPRKHLTVKDLKDWIARCEAKWGPTAFDDRKLHIMNLDFEGEEASLVTDMEWDQFDPDEGDVLSLYTWQTRPAHLKEPPR